MQLDIISGVLAGDLESAVSRANLRVGVVYPSGGHLKSDFDFKTNVDPKRAPKAAQKDPKTSAQRSCRAKARVGSEMNKREELGC